MSQLLALEKATPGFLRNLQRTQTIMLEKATPHGGKFWQGAASNSGIELRWGRSGTTGQVRFLPVGSYQGTPLSELQRRALDKISNGYIVNRQLTVLTTI